jgi:hypothetical protein
MYLINCSNYEKDVQIVFFKRLNGKRQLIFFRRSLIMKKKTVLPFTAVRFLLMLSMVVLLMVGTASCTTAGTVVNGNLGDVRLITGNVLELEF